jgi:hypothetical protein
MRTSQGRLWLKSFSFRNFPVPFGWGGRIFHLIETTLKDSVVDGGWMFGPEVDEFFILGFQEFGGHKPFTSCSIDR